MLNTLLAVFEGLQFQAETVYQALDILWKGLLAIFIVIAMIIIAVKITAFAIDKATEAKKQREEQGEDENQQQ